MTTAFLDARFSPFGALAHLPATLAGAVVLLPVATALARLL